MLASLRLSRCWGKSGEAGALYARKPAAYSLTGFALSNLSQRHPLMCEHNAAVSATDLALLIANMKIISQYLTDYNRFSFSGSFQYFQRVNPNGRGVGGSCFPVIFFSLAAAEIPAPP